MAATAAIAGHPPGLGPPRAKEAGTSPSASHRSPAASRHHAQSSGQGNGNADDGHHERHSGPRSHHDNHHHAAHHRQQHAFPMGAPDLSDDVVSARVMPAARDKTYLPSLLLALKSSPLVEAPEGMPSLQEWYGDWEPFNLRNAGHSANGAGPMSPMGSFGKTDRLGRGGGASGLTASMSAAGAYAGLDDDGYGTGYNKKDRFRKGDERADAMRYGDSSAARRLLNSGKNPFGQISSSGAFKPAGREMGLDSPNDKRGLAMGGRIGRDRGEAIPRNGREQGALNSRRGRGNTEDGADGEEWESVPRSPDHDRRNRPGFIADSAADWRKANSAGERGALGGKNAGRNDRDAGRKTAFPAWMAEDSEPAWMASDNESSGKGRSLEAMDDGDTVDVDTTGMDSIQAFKARMKEKERRERERVQGTASTSTPTKPSGPPPGLAIPNDLDAGQERSTSHDASPSHRQAEAPSHDGMGQAQDANANVEHGYNDPPSLPGRASRFARFFDGKPQAAALAAQQKSMGSGLSAPGGAPEQSGSPLPQSRAHAAPEGHDSPTPQQGNMADFFRAMSASREQQQQQRREEAARSGQSPDAAPPMQRNPSEADVQGMQKIMALLSAGGGSNDGAKQARPPPPPGIELGGPQRQGPSGDHGSPHHRHDSPGPNFAQQHYQSQASPARHPAHSPAAMHGQHAPPPPQGHPHGPNGDWQSPPPSFDGQRGMPGYGPPPPGLDPRMMGGPQGLPPHVAMLLGGGNGANGGGNGQGAMGPLPQGMGRGFPPGMRPGGPPLPPLPPHLQQQLAGLPPQAQHHLLSQHFGGAPFMPPPPPGMHHHPQQPLPPPMSGPMYGNATNSPMSHMYGPGAPPHFGGPNNGGNNLNGAEGNGGQGPPQGDGAAHLMALLGHGPGAGK